MLETPDPAMPQPDTAIVDSLPYGILILGSDKVIQSANPAACDLFGLALQDLIGQGLDQITARETGTPSESYFTERVASADQEAGLYRDVFGIRSDGSQFAAELTLSQLSNGSGALTLAVVRDISEEIEREDRYRILFETSDYPQLIIVGDKFEYANEAAVRAFGCDSVEDFRSTHPSQLSPEFQPDGRDSFSKAEEMMRIAYATGGNRFDWMHCRKNGIEMLMDVILTRMPHMGSDALFCGYRDITERQQREDMVRRTQKMDAIGQLTGGIAHDFNNILGIIKGNLEVLKRALPEHEFAQDRIRAALVGTTRGADLTRKLMAFSHEKTRGTKRINVNQPIREFESLIGKSLTASVKITLDLGEGIWPVDVDAADFENVILNLALNARDAMPGGGTLSINTANKSLDEDYASRNAGASAGEFVMIAVSDTGTGMPPEVRDKVFDPFFTTKDEGKGTGLGLSMVYGFIKQSGGHVKIYTEPGEGTTFRIYLPRAAAEAGDEALESETPLALPRGSETVLAVDDEEALLDVTTAQLEDLGYTVIATSSARRALEILDEQPEINLLFSDVVMPGEMDGFRLGLAAKQRRPDLKVQLTSGFTRQFENNAAGDSDLIEEFSNTLLRKPYNQRELAFAIRQCLDNEDTE